MKFTTVKKEGVEVMVDVIPRSSKSGVIGEHGGRLKIRLSSPPVDGAANKELIKLLSKFLGIAKSRIILVSGANSRKKTLLISGIRLDDILSKLLAI